MKSLRWFFVLDYRRCIVESIGLLKSNMFPVVVQFKIKQPKKDNKGIKLIFFNFIFD